MKLKVLLVGLTAAMLSVSVAVAAPPPGKGKPETAGKPSTTGPTCRPMVTVVLKGTITGTTSGTTSGSLSMTVTHANRWGRAYATAGSATVTTTTDTKVRRNGGKSLTDLKVDDWVLVQARACKAALLTQGTPPTLTAVRVVAHPAKA